MLLPVRRIEAVAAHVLARRGRMHESSVAEVDADMRALLSFLVEEHEIAAAQLGTPHRARGLALPLGVVGNRDARLPEAELHETAAIESGGGRRAAEGIGPAEHLQRVPRGAIPPGLAD